MWVIVWCACLKGFSCGLATGFLTILGQIVGVMKKHPPLLEAQAGELKTPAVATPVAAGFWQRFKTRIRSWFEVPFGYQDENGFHYGVQPAPQVFTDRACDVMTYPTAVASDVPDVLSNRNQPLVK